MVPPVKHYFVPPVNFFVVQLFKRPFSKTSEKDDIIFCTEINENKWHDKTTIG